MKPWLFSLIWAFLIGICQSAPKPPSLTPSTATQNLGLYDSSDKVIILNESNFRTYVIDQNYASVVEFYNSYCGHCRRFAPVYKEIAEYMYPWREFVKVMAIDCAADENNNICREYEVMAYPTIRYLSPKFEPKTTDYGKPINSQNKTELPEIVANLVANETAVRDDWPNFHYLSAAEAHDPFQGVADKVNFIVLMRDVKNVSEQTILTFSLYPELYFRRIADVELASEYGLKDNNHLAIMNRNREIELLQHSDNTVRGFTNALDLFVRMNKLHAAEPTNEPTEKVSLLNVEDNLKVNELIKKVKNNKHMVYQADLEQAIRHIIHNEVPRSNDISGERLLALQRFISVLQRYHPLGPNGRVYIDKLHEYVVSNNQSTSGKEFQAKAQQLEAEIAPIYSSDQYVGCLGSKPNYRGFTCSLWSLFHFLTVQAAESDKSTDPLEVLQAIHGLVKYFFGCTDCSEHFQEMATRRKIWSTSSKDEAVLWLWEAHNEVNNRLAGDQTEDPLFPKVQFPTRESCPLCQRNISNTGIEWNRDAVLSFLKNIHNPSYISRIGIENVDILHANVEKLRQKRMIGNVFSDMDMRMGMLLYGFCIVMMIVAFKLFAYKGYRKRTYAHDFLGKV